MENERILSREDNIRQTVRHLGIIEIYKGHQYLIDAVELAYFETEIDRLLYMTIANKHLTWHQSIQRYLRSCIKRAIVANPKFYTQITACAPNDKLPLTKDFICAIIIWVQRHDAVLKRLDESVIDIVEWKNIM